MKSLFQITFVILCLLSGVQLLAANAPHSSQEDYLFSKVNRIAPAEDAISIQTEPGKLYTHIEGAHPNWRIGIISDIYQKHTAFEGDGSLQNFKISNPESTYHIVEEGTLQGKLYLNLVGDYKASFKYFIMQDENTIDEGEVYLEDLSSIAPVFLPVGNYTIQIYSEGYHTPKSLEFAISPDEEFTLLDISLNLTPALLNITASPRELTQGQNAILRHVDPTNGKEIWAREIALWSDPIEIESGEYMVEFPSIEGYASPGDQGYLGRYRILKGPYQIVGEYTPNPGIALINYEVSIPHEEFEQISFELISPQGERLSFPGTNSDYLASEENFTSLKVSDLTPGTYTLQFKSPREGSDSFYLLPGATKFAILPGESTELDFYFPSNSGGIQANLSLPAENQGELPWIRVIDEKGNFIAESVTGELNIVELIPGQYTLAYGPLKGLSTPHPVDFEIRPGEQSGPFTGVYAQKNGALIVTYSAGVFDDKILNQVRFWLHSTDGSKMMFPKEGEYLDAPGNQGRKVIIPDLPVGEYELSYVFPNEAGLFSPIPNQTISVNEGQVTQVKTKLSPRYISLTINTTFTGTTLPEQKDSLITLTNEKGEIFGETGASALHLDSLLPGKYRIIFGDIKGFTTPTPIDVVLAPGIGIGPIEGSYTPELSYFSLKTNRPDLRWVLQKDGEIILSQKGSSDTIELPSGKGYALRTETPKGWSLKNNFKDLFILHVNEHIDVELQYTQEFGTLAIETEVDTGDEVAFSVRRADSEDILLESTLIGASNTVYWESETLPVGNYVISYSLPSSYLPIQDQEVTVRNETLSIITPIFVITGSTLSVHTNEPTSVYTLSSVQHAKEWEGNGEDFIFKGLRPGPYLLIFAPLDNKNAISPEPMQINIPKNGEASISAFYAEKAALIVSANVKSYSINLTRLDGKEKGRSYVKHVKGGAQSFSFPSGQYRLQFLPIEGKDAVRYGGNHPDPSILDLSSSKAAYLHGSYKESSGSLAISTNLDEASFTVKELATGNIIGTFQGSENVIPFTFSGEYEVKFNDVYGFHTPEPLITNVHANQRNLVGGTYSPLIESAFVKRGPVIVGDIFGEGASDERPTRTVDLSAFSIATKAVTNSEYATWLSLALEKGLVSYVNHGENKGRVFSKDGLLLFETLEADPNSQIYPKNKGKFFAFQALDGFENHPVIEVSWYGAKAYCSDQGFHLPTEAQWEKSASMASTADGAPLKKFRYGVGRDIINPQLANYTAAYRRIDNFIVATREVAFYNGINLLTTNKDLNGYEPTLAALSPWGCYDMSGNVREWVSDWYAKDYYEKIPAFDPQGPAEGSQKVTKGGSYGSFSYETRASARMPLSPETTDAYTGFRVVIEK